VTRVLVTGATGAIGRHVVPALQGRGFEVRAQYNRQPGVAPGVEWRHADFLGETDYDGLVAGCDAVVHLAAALGHIPDMPRLNVELPLRLLGAAQNAGARYFGHASSIVVYGSPLRREVDESTPLVDPEGPMVRQYHAEPFMLEYARTKALAELGIRAAAPRMKVDLYRPAVVAELDRLLEARDWSRARRFGAAYRRTQYIYVGDVAAAIAHLVRRGLDGAPSIEAFNLADEDCGTYRDILRAGYEKTGHPGFKPGPELPVVLDLLKDLAKYRNKTLRYPLGMLDFSSKALLSTGFRLPTGFKAALAQALAG
jgi:nucleoside-diphosphate-sugar epimerase